MLELGMHRPLDAHGLTGEFAGLVLEQVHGVAGVMPQQVVRPAARLAQRVRVGAAEEIGLHVHLLDLQLAGRDTLVDPLMAGIEAAGVAAHGDQPGLLLHGQDRLGVGQAVGDRDLDLHVLAGAHALHRLLRMHLRRRGEDHRLQARLVETFRQVRRPMRYAEFLRHFTRGIRTATRQGDDLDAVDIGDRLQMFDAESALSCQSDLHVLPLLSVFQNDVADRRVGSGHMIETVDLSDLVVEGAAHDQPHDHFYSFRTGFAHVFQVGNAYQ